MPGPLCAESLRCPCFPSPERPNGPGQRDLRCNQTLAPKSCFCPALLGANDPEKCLATQPLFSPGSRLPMPRDHPGSLPTDCSGNCCDNRLLTPTLSSISLLRDFTQRRDQEKQGKATRDPFPQILQVPAVVGGPCNCQKTQGPLQKFQEAPTLSRCQPAPPATSLPDFPSLVWRIGDQPVPLQPPGTTLGQQ